LKCLDSGKNGYDLHVKETLVKKPVLQFIAGIQEIMMDFTACVP
jgi:hypothetical protein